MTLVEVLVAMSLSVLLVAGVGSFAVVGIRTMDAAQARGDNISAGQVGMAAATKVIRTAVLPDQLADAGDAGCPTCVDSAIITANGTQVTFYANLNNGGSGPSLVTLETIANPAKAGTSMLRQTTVPPITAADGSYSFCTVGATGCTFTRRILTRGLPALSTSPVVFTYFGLDGVPLPGGNLSATNLVNVASIDVALTVQLRSGQTRTPSQALIQRVALPNAAVTTPSDKETP